MLKKTNRRALSDILREIGLMSAFSRDTTEYIELQKYVVEHPLFDPRDYERYITDIIDSMDR